jgi:single-stranded DNA-specific DHH superfamily exonuclease
MNNVSDGFFAEFGGHHASGGFSFSVDKKDLFENEMRLAFKKYKQDKKNNNIEDSINIKEISYNITHNNVDNFLLKHLFQMKPFGMNNPNPLFCIRQVSFSSVKLFGKQKEHAEFIVKNFLNDSGQIETVTPELFRDTYKYSSQYNKVDVVRYISFFADNSLLEIKPDTEYDMYSRVEASNFLGKKEIRVKVECINVSSK